ncbi:MAG: lysylphosphatidylglycerol synthase domain-containing protein [Steroidobacteraceae bacterium]
MILGVAAWGTQALILHAILAGAGVSISLQVATFIFALAVLAGALSFVPAGLGVIEASLFVLLTWRRVPAPEAAVVIVLFRLVTVWFGAGLAWALGAKRPELDAEA